MTIYVFVGPSLSPTETAVDSKIVFLPPVAQGDVYRVAQERPRAIGIIDGFFEGKLAVWHKEILWAMAEGIHVFGSASMGALRAAELHTFGMRGVGRIFEAYRDGEFEDDDEVALLHGPAETGYLPLSEPMANVRATLARAEQQGIVGTATRNTLIALCKRMFYQMRSWEALFAASARECLPLDELAALRAWLPAGRIDQKREDALEMLAAMRAFLASDPPPLRVDYAFEWTDMWNSAVRRGRAHDAAPTIASGSGETAEVLDELRLDEELYRSVADRALSRYLTANPDTGHRQEIDESDLRAAAHRLRSRLGLFRQADLDRWLADNGLDGSAFRRLLAGDARIHALRASGDARFCAALIDQLRAEGHYARLAARANDKQRVLATRGDIAPDTDDAGSPRAQLAAWYFNDRLGRPIPDDLDRFVRELGLSNRQDFYRILARELVYLTALGEVEKDLTLRSADAAPDDPL